MNLQAEFERIKQELDQYFDTNYSSDLAEESENTRIKGEIERLIVDAHKQADRRVLEDALELLAENTGCAQDYMLFQNIARNLIAQKILTNDELKKLLAGSPVARWLDIK